MIAERSLKDFQIIGKNALIENQHFMLLDDMGIGKTVQVCAAIAELKITALIICRKSLKYQWLEELVLWGAFKRCEIFVIQTGADIIPTWAKCVIVNSELVVKFRIASQVMPMTFGAVIYDEGQDLKNSNTNRTQMILGERGPIIGRGYYKWVLSGTIAPNHPIDLYTWLAALFPDAIAPYHTFEEFAIHLCGGVYSNGRWFYTENTDERLDELSRRIANCYLRREIRDVFPDLPPVIESELYFDVGDIVDDEGKVISDNNCDLSTLRRRIGLAKTPFVVQFINEKLSNDGIEKLCVFAYHRDVLDELERQINELGIKTSKVYGGQNDRVREEEKRRFIEGDARVFILQIKVGGTGIDKLQYVTSHCVQAELDWVVGDTDQMAGRLERYGQENVIHLYRCIAQNTLNEAMLGTYYQRKKQLDMVWSNPIKREHDTTIRKEQKMGLSEDTLVQLTRIADALEKIAFGGVQLGTNATVENEKPASGNRRGGNKKDADAKQQETAATTSNAPDAASAATGAATPPTVTWQQVTEKANHLLLDLYKSSPEGVAAIIAAGAKPFGLDKFMQNEDKPQNWPQIMANLDKAIAEKEAADKAKAAQPSLGSI